MKRDFGNENTQLIKRNIENDQIQKQNFLNFDIKFREAIENLKLMAQGPTRDMRYIPFSNLLHYFAKNKSDENLIKELLDAYYYFLEKYKGSDYGLASQDRLLAQMI
jgi:hypothetical protein